MTTEIKTVKLSDIHEYDGNPRQIKKEDFEKLKKSLKEFPEMLEVREIVIDETGAILGGNQRYKALLANGETEATVKQVTGWSENQKREFVIKDNIANGEWDTDILANQWDDLPLDDWGIGIELDEEPEEVIEDEAPEPPEEPKSKLGDIYQLGEHRLMCGDSTKPEDVEKLMGGVQADMVFTDPPYNMNYVGGGFLESHCSMTRNEIKNIIDFDPTSIEYIKNLGIPNIFIFTSKDLLRSYFDIFNDWAFNVLLWCKTGTPPFINNNYYSDTEYLLYFHKGKRVWNNGLEPNDIYKKFFISKMKQGKDDAGTDLHPTMKPIQFIANEIRICSNNNGVVLDLFGGSGSTLIACEQLDRKCYMMELDPHYVDVIIERWENFTRDKAKKIN